MSAEITRVFSLHGGRWVLTVQREGMRIVDAGGKELLEITDPDHLEALGAALIGEVRYHRRETWRLGLDIPTTPEAVAIEEARQEGGS